jgi:restriction system protein
MSRSKTLGIKLIYAALSILRDNGKEMPMRDLLEKLEQRVELDDWARERYEKSGYVRWQSILHFYSIGCIKAGYLIKKKGVWYVTPEGIEALKLGPDGLMKSAESLYREWKASQPDDDVSEVTEPEIENEAEEQYPLDQATQFARSSFEKYINAKNPYEFQDLVAALLRGMGYYTPFVAPKGKDGGIDIVAYRDPLGTQSPRIQAQIKHRESSAKADEIRQLMGLLQKEGAVGIFVSTGGFTPDARSTARSSHVHVELIDLTRFISLWQEFYDKLSDEDKSLMPIRPVYFVAPQDQ